ncbi:MAG: gamma-glutamylcyclotransferase [Hyphomicrobiales bacterium]|nr:gamma-glutamylcyclotransferase [Hyphomicrobiales bacterium]
MPEQVDEERLPLFVYGTLKRASRAPFAQRLAMESRYIGRGTVRGKLYSLGSYPGLVRDPAAQFNVHGEVVRLKTPRSFVWLDNYEGCGPGWPQPHEYERIVLQVHLQKGEKIACWAYIFKGKVTSFRWIPSGRFIQP